MQQPPPFPPLLGVVSVSGMRALVGQGMDPVRLSALAAVYGAVLARRGTVLLGRDSRPTGEALAQAAAAGLRAVGCKVVDLGIVPTPTVPIMISQLGAAGGLQISASHNPVPWNALKCFTAAGRNIDASQLEQLLAAYAQPPADLWCDWSGYGALRQEVDLPRQVHLERVLAAVDLAAIRAAALPVLVDSVNGAGSYFAADLMMALGCQALSVHDDPSRLFPRDPEPTAANVTSTGALVVASKSAVGFVQDPDADRLALIDERGRYIGEEYTLVLCALARLQQPRRSRKTPKLVTNLSTSRMLEAVASRHGARVLRTPVGEANVVDGIEAAGALLGGEGNGGVIDPRVVLGRDSMIGMALVLELLARSGRRLSELVAELPRLHMHKEKIALDRAGVAAALPALQRHPLAIGATIDTRDGIVISHPDRWAHLRASGTEPVSRIITEAPSPREAHALAAILRQAALQSLSPCPKETTMRAKPRQRCKRSGHP